MTTPDSHDELMQSGLNLIQQAISIFDADLRLALSNRQYQRMFALPDRLVRPGAGFEDTIAYLVARGEYGPQNDPQAAVRMRVDQARTFQPHYLERTRPDGRTISVEGAPLAQGGWIAVYTDITDIKRTESLLRARSEELSGQLLSHAERLSAANRQLAATNAALEEAKRVLTEAEARTRQVTAMVPAHIAHVDAEGRYTFSNQQLGAVFPGAARDIVGCTSAEVLGETFARIRPALDRALAGEPQVMEVTHTESGRRIRVALTPDPQGAGAYVLSTDVTAEVNTREALTHAARRELAAQMTSGLAHDFGNLLTIILGLQGRLARLALQPEAAADVAGTLAAARRGAALLDRIATITGPRRLTPEPVDLPALLDQLAAMARPSLGRGVTLELDCDLPQGAVLLDPGSLQDSLLNLILNARDAISGTGAGSGSTHGAIRLSARVRGRWLELTVIDSGPGFAPEALARATEPFFTTKPGQGSGLGLPMVYDQTKLAGGTLRLDNAPGGGARVRLRLPFQRVARRLVLLVDDDDLIRETLREMLTGMGQQVIEAGSLSEARSLADLPGLSVILSDLQLGDGSGADLGALGLPLILMTARPPDDPERQGLSQPVLTKPFDAASLNALFAGLPDDK
ncbi:MULTISPECIES: PAS-domain containing protein [unclassified Paracoccus (in: a-proteobacteria)]|uniref:PAS-domain containing protein n=1 Tax=unclassified Paracoccus (in: a-proteobacteria) TaxID=2688777 RepID=UPI0016020CAB|nr:MULTISPECIES: PAS-domain containing protein [unclassified Paracoccus (in: a-proteobacteria)]MBB1492262.1 PAS-domain containing protein [Paracoccus sp. MC1854]MBB1497867.1 PAS-domain containing protein [Paracoccus sp. MC1862]QQO44263.1 PAS-domain containing protein [Paracoccus sp. MC1862]